MIKKFDEFINEGESPKPVLLKNFAEAENKLSDEDGCVIQGVTGDMSDIDDAIKDIPHTAAYVLITDDSSASVDGRKSDVFLVDGPVQSDGMSIMQYFETSEATNEGTGISLDKMTKMVFHELFGEGQTEDDMLSSLMVKKEKIEDGNIIKFIYAEKPFVIRVMEDNSK
jgi:hypothetical protein